MRAVGQQAHPVARHRVADAVDHREGGGRLGRVAEVAQRHAARPGRASRSRRSPGVRRPAAVLRQHHGVGAGPERRARRRPRAWRPGLRRAEDVDDAQRRQPLEEPGGLERRRQHRPARQQEAQRREVVRPRASSSSSSGRAKGSPTICSDVDPLALARWRARRPGRAGWDRPGTTTVPPDSHAEMAFQWAAPCMNGRRRQRPQRAPAARRGGHERRRSAR